MKSVESLRSTGNEDATLETWERILTSVDWSFKLVKEDKRRNVSFVYNDPVAVEILLRELKTKESLDSVLNGLNSDDGSM